jgi:hypothetical protein
LSPWRVEGGREGRVLGVPSTTSASAKGDGTWARRGGRSLARGEGAGVHWVEGTGGSLCGLSCVHLRLHHTKGGGTLFPRRPGLHEGRGHGEAVCDDSGGKERVATLQRGCEWIEVMVGGCTYDFGHMLKGGRMGAGEGGEREYEAGQTVECRYTCYN